MFWGQDIWSDPQDYRSEECVNCTGSYQLLRAPEERGGLERNVTFREVKGRPPNKSLTKGRFKHVLEEDIPSLESS